MPYYHVDISHNKSTQFVVNAPNKESAEDIALVAEAGHKLDPKKIVKLREGGSHTISIDETNKAGWADALKQQKASK
jgi:hypothetical protein